MASQIEVITVGMPGPPGTAGAAVEELLASQVVSAVSEVLFSTLSAYTSHTDFKLVGTRITGSTAGVRISPGEVGSVFGTILCTTTGVSTRNGSAGVTVTNTSGVTYIDVVRGGGLMAGSTPINFELLINNLLAISTYRVGSFRAYGNIFFGSTNLYNDTAAVSIDSSQPTIDAFRIAPTTGLLTGIFSLYGVKRV